MSRSFKDTYYLALYQLVECDFLEKSEVEYFYSFARFLSLLFIAFIRGDITEDKFLEECKDAFNFMKERF